MSLSQHPDVSRFLTERYEYELPESLIAQSPAARRDESRLLVLDEGLVAHRCFGDIVSLTRPCDLFVVNDTRVLRARFRPKRRGGGKAEVLLLHPTDDEQWEALVRPGHRVRVGDHLSLSLECGIDIAGRTELGTRIVRFKGIGAQEAM